MSAAREDGGVPVGMNVSAFGSDVGVARPGAAGRRGDDGAARAGAGLGSGATAGRGDDGVAASGIERLATAFARVRAEGRAAALMPYVMGGFPTLGESQRIGEACAAAGADVIELGVPYSDPLADGPVIHDAGTRALAAGASVAGVLEVARALAAHVPVVLMCYANMVFAPGADAFVARLARSGACGLIVPDLPLEEAPQVLAACDAHGVALVPLVAPTTPPQRLAQIGARARGFLYTVSVVGTTGERAALAERFAEIVARAKAATAVPVALGFGISTPEQATQAARAGADGVIVGSRLVRAAGESADPAGAVGALVAELATALRAGASVRPAAAR
jgi:tryptophan synthase alpha chain